MHVADPALRRRCAERRWSTGADRAELLRHRRRASEIGRAKYSRRGRVLGEAYDDMIEADLTEQIARAGAKGGEEHDPKEYRTIREVAGPLMMVEQRGGRHL